jgi:prepilin-type N-terminal cleavage/methylation domain-containing protein
MKKAMPASRQGFTLIEMMVVVSILAVIMVTVISTLLSSFKAKNRVDTADRLEQNGSFALNEIRNNILNSDGKNVTCGVGSSITFVNRQDGQQISIECIEGGAIASVSAGLVTDLTVGVSASNCSNFVNCDTLATGEMTAANIGFTLSVGAPGAGPENYVSRSFLTKVAVRAY